VNYYNEHDSKVAAWLRELIKAGFIPAGDVDERSIAEVKPNELRHYTQCHFFAGIGGWSLALQIAGWPADRPVWTGSCPCQPFSTAGKGLGDKDERHLWPVFFDLIRQCRPELVFGEQVANAIGKGWLDGISADLESENYTCGATVLGAHSVGSPHIRQRLYWGAAKQSEEWQRVIHSCECDEDGSCPVCEIDYSECGCPGPTQHDEYEYRERNGILEARRLVLANSDGCEQRSDAATTSRHGNTIESAGSRGDRMGIAEQQRLEGFSGTINERSEPGRIGQNENGSTTEAGFWTDYRLAKCRDGKARRIPTESAFFPLAHGIPARVVRLRGYGNAIVPQVAAEFIKAFYEITT
jgi:DNA (cytosine-5)-methyltransferase 1